MASLLGVAALVASVTGCGSNKNHDTREAVARALAEDDDRRNCVDPYLCTPDPGPRPMSPEECELKTGDLDFLEIWNFQSWTNADELDLQYVPGTSTNIYYGQTLYAYDDKTTFRRFPPRGYEVEAFSIERCGEENNHAFRGWGGPYLAWGGGLGTRVDRLWNDQCGPSRLEQEIPDFCPPEDTEFPQTWDVNYAYPTGQARQGYWLDLSEWDGISFWARRGPDGQPSIRVAIADTNVDADISFLQHYQNPDAPRTCENNKYCGCKTQRPCTRFAGNRHLRVERGNGSAPDLVYSPLVYDQLELTPGGPVPGQPPVRESETDAPDFYFCYDPEIDPEPDAVHPDGKYLIVRGEDGIDQHRYEACGPSVCNMLMEGFQAKDAKFHDKPCTEYTFRTGLHGAYCFDPETDPPPVPSSEECGDIWMKSVELSVDWRFYKIPFSELLQQGWAKEFHELRLDQVSTVRFTWGRGYTDFWLDDVAFYRKKRD